VQSESAANAQAHQTSADELGRQMETRVFTRNFPATGAQQRHVAVNRRAGRPAVRKPHEIAAVQTEILRSVSNSVGSNDSPRSLKQDRLRKDPKRSQRRRKEEATGGCEF